MKYTRACSVSAFAMGMLYLACHVGEDGKDGAPGVGGTNGAPGTGGAGAEGAAGTTGKDGKNGSDGATGKGLGGLGGNKTRAPGIDPATPLSAVVAVSLSGDGAADIPAYVRSLATRFARGKLTGEAIQFPLAAAATDTFRAIEGLTPSVVVKWLDPLTFGSSARFGANADYIAYFGDAWNANAADPPQWRGRGDAGWMWVNHEYVSGAPPTTTAAGTSQQAVLARFMTAQGLLGAPSLAGRGMAQVELDLFIAQEKREVGGSWLRVVRDPASSVWSVDLAAANRRYDATSDTLARVTGTSLSGLDHADDGSLLPSGVVAGIQGNCAGGQTPWGTVITAEENVQDSYGDLESCWDSNQKLLAGAGCDAGGDITWTTTPSGASVFGAHSKPSASHPRDGYGYLVEIDPGKSPGEYDGKTTAGVGHKKLGAMGRARWEGATFAVTEPWRLAAGKPIVMYAGDDRRGGRIYKLVSKAAWQPTMSRAETRALLDEGKLYVAHFAGLDNADGYKLKSTGAPPTADERGRGRWIELSVDNTTDDAPNASAAGFAGMKVGAALKATSYNRLGGFPTNDDVRRALFTASNKLGIMELNRPERIEWNPRSPLGKPQLFVAFTNHGRRTALDDAGLVFDPATHATSSTVRGDKVGAMFVIEEADPASPGTSTTFGFFQVWNGSLGATAFDAANIDNIVIDREGGVWFGTDGNFGTNKHADAFYYLDLDPAHRSGQPGVVMGSFGRAFRVLAGPSDAEMTGPAFTSDMRTIFVSVQHPGEDTFSAWP